MSELKDKCFQGADGQAIAEVGDKVGLVLNEPPTFLSKVRLYTIAFNYSKDGQRYLSDSKEGLCFVDSDRDSVKVYDSYEKASQVMNELAATSFPNEGILQVCSLELNAVGEASKGNPELLGSFG